MKTILVIDDDPSICILLRKFLEPSGYRVVEAADGRAGLRLFGTMVIDLIITDILMPETDGLTVIREVRAQAPEVGIIALSGGGMTLTAETSLHVAMRMGAIRSLTKPFTKNEVVAMVEAVFGLSPLSSSAEGQSPAVA